jgi:hypothetical protein
MLADGVHKVLVDHTGGGLRIITGRGDDLILRGARPEVIPNPSEELDPYRFVPIGNRSSPVQRSVQTKAGELWFNGYGKRGEALFLRRELVGLTGVDHAGFLATGDGTPIGDGGLVAVTYVDLERDELSFAGVTAKGEVQWTVPAGSGVLLTAHCHAGQVIAIVRGPDDARALSFAVADGKVLWKREL